MALTPYVLAVAISIERLAREETPVTADTALRLGKYFGTTAAFWMKMQGQFDLETTEDSLAGEIRKIKPRAVEPVCVPKT